MRRNLFLVAPFPVTGSCNQCVALLLCPGSNGLSGRAGNSENGSLHGV
jgi:hypothetical protein